MKAMQNCGWGKASGYDRVLATLLKKDGFEEILRTYVNDVKNQNPTGNFNYSSGLVLQLILVIS